MDCWLILVSPNFGLTENQKKLMRQKEWCNDYSRSKKIFSYKEKTWKEG